MVTLSILEGSLYHDEKLYVFLRAIQACQNNQIQPQQAVFFLVLTRGISAFLITVNVKELWPV